MATKQQEREALDKIAEIIKGLEEGVESSASRVMALENENVHLKARLYDILMK